MPHDDASPKKPLELAAFDVDAEELKNAGLALLLAGKRFLNALGAGAVVRVEVGGPDVSLRIHVTEKPRESP